jgi:hypothetical protein
MTWVFSIPHTWSRRSNGDDFEMSNEMEKTEDPHGIRGWLILPILGFVGTIVLTVINLLQTLTVVDGLTAIFTASTGPLSALKIPAALSLIAGILVVASASYCLVLIYTKGKAIKKIATAHYLIVLCAALSELWGESVLLKAAPGTTPDPSTMRYLLRAASAAIIWIPYFHFSKRVKNTFTK